jgi:predicted acylesterase/phospholipase RssA
MENPTTTTTPTIKHIVIAGGGITGLSYYGALKQSHANGEWKLENIETIYGTSIGSIIGVFIALNYEWSVLDTYIIQRPWQNVFKFNMYSVLEAIQKRGIYTVKVIEDTFLPLFSAKDISINITLAEFFETTKIDLHIFSTELNTFKLVDFSHKTHPDWRVVDAVFCSSSLPILLSPFKIEDSSAFYSDGGILLNYPLLPCIQNGAKLEEILGVTRKEISNEDLVLKSDSTLVDYMLLLINKILENLILRSPRDKIGREYVVESTIMSMHNIFNAVNKVEERERIISVGEKVVGEATASLP